MLHCDLKVRWKVASDLRFRAAISEPKTPSFCGISGDLAPSTRNSLAIAIVRFWCAKISPVAVGNPPPTSHASRLTPALEEAFLILSRPYRSALFWMWLHVQNGLNSSGFGYGTIYSNAVLIKWGLLWDYLSSNFWFRIFTYFLYFSYFFRIFFVFFPLEGSSLFELPFSISGENRSLNEHLRANFGLKCQNQKWELK